MGRPTLAHSLRMRLLLLLILPFLNGRSIVRERNDVIKQALIPTLVNIIGHARMVEHGTGDDVDNLLDFMDEEKILDPFLSWLGWFTDMVVKGDDTSSEETVVRERNDVIKQALIPTLVNIIRHARMAEHGTGIDELLDLINKDKLDWDRPWQAWPITCCLGAVAGHVAGNVLGACRVWPKLANLNNGHSKRKFV